MPSLLYKEEAYKIISLCMKIHNELKKRFNQILYGNALEIEFIDNKVNYSREKKFDIDYKGNLLPHKYKTDFIINDEIILETKAITCLTTANVKQAFNYLAVSIPKLGLLINFGEDSLKYKRITL